MDGVRLGGKGPVGLVPDWAHRLQRLVHRVLEFGPGVDVVVAGAGDGPVEHQLPTRRSQAIGAAARNDLVVLRRR